MSQLPVATARAKDAGGRCGLADECVADVDGFSTQLHKSLETITMMRSRWISYEGD